MKLSKKRTRFLATVLDDWVNDQVISEADRLRLSNTIETISFDWKRLAKYSFWIALICLCIAVITIISDSTLTALLERLFNTPAIVKCVFFTILSIALYYTGIVKKKTAPEKLYSNDAIFFLGVVSTAAAFAFLGQVLDNGSGHFSILILLTTISYAILGLWIPSTLIWLFALFSFGAWFGAETGYISGWGAYYLGMNYPLRFIFFGAILILGSYLFKYYCPSKKSFFKITRTVGLLYLLIALWILSIFGNYGDIDSWFNVKQFELFYWSILFGLVALVVLGHGIKFDDPVTRGFGLTFLFINLYTRFFEYAWDSIHKAVFFALMGASFWILGKYAEKVWNIGSGAIQN